MIYLTNIDSVEPDQKMNQEKGFAAMELRWLLSGANAPVTLCTIGHTRKQKGGEHRLHHHLHADEVILMLHGKAIEVVGDERLNSKKGIACSFPGGSSIRTKSPKTRSKPIAFISAPAVSIRPVMSWMKNDRGNTVLVLLERAAEPPDQETQ
jgi:mannose-6-phosphate isomerase-like protein (cupin superfamily)